MAGGVGIGVHSVGGGGGGAGGGPLPGTVVAFAGGPVPPVLTVGSASPRGAPVLVVAPRPTLTGTPVPLPMQAYVVQPPIQPSPVLHYGAV